MRHFVKICGVTSLEDARVVVDAGADATGVIFASSPRQMSVEAARPLLAALEGATLRVGVFRHQSDDEIRVILDRVEVDAVQLHDPLGSALLGELRARRLVVIKALGVDSARIADFDEGTVDAVLVDGPRPGTGAAHSWEPLVRRRFSVPVIAAGGLTPDNVASTIAVTSPAGVDCASGVESAPGRKDPDLVAAFVANARAAFAAQEGT